MFTGLPFRLVCEKLVCIVSNITESSSENFSFVTLHKGFPFLFLDTDTCTFTIGPFVPFFNTGAILPLVESYRTSPEGYENENKFQNLQGAYMK